MCKEERKFLLMIKLGSIVPNELYRKYNICENCAFAEKSIGFKMIGGRRKECNKRKTISVKNEDMMDIIPAEYCYNWKRSVKTKCGII